MNGKIKNYKSKINNFGFTLIELLMVLFIISVLFGLGYTNYRDYSRRQLLNTAVRQMEEDIRLIQEKAISGVKPASGDPAENCDVLFGWGIKFYQGMNMYDVFSYCKTGTKDDKDIYKRRKITTVNLPNEVIYEIDKDIQLDDVRQDIFENMEKDSVIYKVLGLGTDLSLNANPVTVQFTQAGTNYGASLIIYRSGRIAVQFN